MPHTACRSTLYVLVERRLFEPDPPCIRVPKLSESVTKLAGRMEGPHPDVKEYEANLGAVEGALARGLEARHL